MAISPFDIMTGFLAGDMFVHGYKAYLLKKNSKLLDYSSAVVVAAEQDRVKTLKGYTHVIETEFLKLDNLLSKVAIQQTDLCNNAADQLGILSRFMALQEGKQPKYPIEKDVPVPTDEPKSVNGGVGLSKGYEEFIHMLEYSRDVYGQTQEQKDALTAIITRVKKVHDNPKRKK